MVSSHQHQHLQPRSLLFDRLLTMKIVTLLLVLSLPSTDAFQARPALSNGRFSRTTNLNIVLDDNESALEKIKLIIAADDYPDEDPEFDKIVKSSFPHALSNQQLETRVVDVLGKKGYSGSNTLLATSLCCDELARRLEDDFVKIYGDNFFLGGLSGFPFAGNTGFGAMSAHIPDDGYCLIMYGPHVGISKSGLVGKVERRGIELLDNCCGSAIAASNYLEGITSGGAEVNVNIQSFTDFQQGAVQELILPYGKRLMDAENRMLELPYALYETQDLLMRTIVHQGAAGLKKGTALLGGIQINTSPDTLDYFHPLRFDYLDSNGEFVENMLPLITKGQPAVEEAGEEELV